MRATPITVARNLSTRWFATLAPAIPGFRPDTHKRNVIVFLTYLLGLLFGVHVLHAVLS